jgi:hypothetical protein
LAIHGAADKNLKLVVPSFVGISALDQFDDYATAGCSIEIDAALTAQPTSAVTCKASTYKKTVIPQVFGAASTFASVPMASILGLRPGNATQSINSMDITLSGISPGRSAQYGSTPVRTLGIPATMAVSLVENVISVIPAPVVSTTREFAVGLLVADSSTALSTIDLPVSGTTIKLVGQERNAWNGILRLNISAATSPHQYVVSNGVDNAIAQAIGPDNLNGVLYVGCVLRRNIVNIMNDSIWQLS